jgi:hypothetical protein
MKTIILMLLLVPMITSSQLKVDYQNIPPIEGRYGSYLTKNGSVISLGDSITIGVPTGPYGFRFIASGKFDADNVIAGRTVKVARIRTFKRNRLRNKVFLEFKSYGILAPFRIDYEMALQSGELEAPEQ